MKQIVLLVINMAKIGVPVTSIVTRDESCPVFAGHSGFLIIPKSNMSVFLSFEQAYFVINSVVSFVEFIAIRMNYRGRHCAVILVLSFIKYTLLDFVF